MVLRVDKKWLNDYERKMGKKVSGETEPVKALDAPGYRSKLEAAFANLLSLCKRTGRIKDWWYEPEKLKLHAKSVIKDGKERVGHVYYIPDFRVEHNDGTIEMIETKGYLRKDGELKYYEAVEKHDCYRWRMVKQEKGVWINMHIKGEDILF
jgi:hypothetical protein